MKQVDPYEALNVNAYGVLKPPLLLWVIFLIETWHYWSSALMVSSGQTWLLIKGFGWENFAAEASALLVILALSARLPKANKLARWLWHRGRELLTLAALANLALIIVNTIRVDFWRIDNEWSSLLAAFLHIWVLARIWMSPIIAQVFSEFPD